MANLDELKTYRQLDASHMLRHLRIMPEQCQLAWEHTMESPLPQGCDKVDKVIILGMGGSAIGGDLVRSLATLENRIPVWVHRDYGVPPFLDENTLLIASSYSGNTEETLSAFTASLAVPAKRLVLASGGKLKALAESQSVPVICIDYQAPPRAAFPHSFIPLLAIFHRLGLLADKTADFAEAIQVLHQVSSQLVEDVPAASNPAKQLATDLSGRLAVLYGAGILSEVARRWKTQLNENSKAWAFHELLPELNHNAVVGYEFPSEVRERILVVLIHSSLLHPRTSARYRLTTEILAKAGVRHKLIEAMGHSALAHMMSLVLFGDYVSVYLALLNGIDPTPVPVIDYLKSRLAEP